MCKFALYHSEEFDHPQSAFLLGVLVVIVNCYCEFANLFQSLSFSSVDKIIGKFVGFKVLIQVHDYYNRSRANFRIRDAVSKFPLVIKEDQNNLFFNSMDGPRNGKAKKDRACIIIMIYVYKSLRLFYTSIYFYFFP